MRRYPSSWDRLLVALGFRRRVNRVKRSNYVRNWRRAEALESRELLTVTVYEISTLADVSSYGGANDWSLREAILHSAADPHNDGADTIVFSPTLAGQVILLGDTNGDGAVGSGESASQLSITSSVVIDASAAPGLTISGNEQSRIFNASGANTLTLKGLRLVDGKVTGHGGAIYSSANLKLDQVTIHDSEASSWGGAIYVTQAALDVNNSEFVGNLSYQYGGAIGVYVASSGSAVSIDGSTFQDNRTPGLGTTGGGLHVHGNNSNEVLVTSSTFSENSSGVWGGGLSFWNTASTVVVNSTIVDNLLDHTNGSFSAGIFQSNGLLEVYNTVIAGNENNSVALPSSVTTEPSNYFSTSDADAFVAPLGFYGGPTRTRPSLAGGPLIDEGNNALAADFGVYSDQRGLARVVDGDGDLTYTVDIGAYEYVAGPIVVNTTSDGAVGAGEISLRQAIALAAATPGDDTIVFDPAVFSTPQTIMLQDQDGDGVEDALQLHDLDDGGDRITILGPAANLLTIHGGSYFGGVTYSGGAISIFDIDADAAATIAGLTATGATTSAIVNLGDLTLDGVEVKGNGGHGVNSWIASSLEIVNSTIAENLAAGVQLFSAAASTITNSTIAKNKKSGVTVTDTDLVVTNATITENQFPAGISGGGILVDYSSSLTLRNSIVVGNVRVDGLGGTLPRDIVDISAGTATFAGSNNLIGDGGTTSYPDGAAIAAVALLPLGDYGGPTRTYALDPLSDAIDAGNNSHASALDFDQRGYDRTQDGDNNTSNVVDVGAYEFGSTILVTTSEDTLDAYDGVISLREAIALANTSPNAAVIELDPSVFSTAQTITLSYDGLDGNSLPDTLAITGDITIVGPGANLLTLDGDGLSRIFSISATATATIHGVSIADGHSSLGGGIYSQGNLTLDSVELFGNEGGAVVAADGTLTIRNSAIYDNEGAIGAGNSFTYTERANGAVSVRISDSSVFNNTSIGSAIVGSNDVNFEIIHTTITGNVSTDMIAGGIDAASGLVVMHNSIVAGNRLEESSSVSNYDISNYSLSTLSTNNLIGFGQRFWSEPIWDTPDPGANNQIGVAVASILLGEPGYYGGSTKSIPLLEGSLAIDAGNSLYGTLVDQRGISRPTDGDGDLTYTVDIGAYEYVAGPIVVNTTSDGAVGAGEISLRQAIALAAATPGDDTIVFDPAVFSTPQTITLQDQDGDGVEDALQLHDLDDGGDRITIFGPGADLLTIHGGATHLGDGLYSGGTDYLFQVDADSAATIAGLTITGSRLTAVINFGDLIADGVEVKGNGWVGLNNREGSTLTLVNSTVVENSASGVLFYSAAASTITNSTIAKNKLSGISVTDTDLVVTNATITENQYPPGTAGGGILVQDFLTPRTLTVRNSIVVGNVRVDGSGGTLQRDIVDLSLGSVTFAGSDNLIGDSGGTSLSGGATVAGVALLPLGDYGGPTRTYALDPLSDAIDAGNNAYASTLDFDQRGFGFDRVLGAAVDIGAIEAAVVVDGINLFVYGTSIDDAIHVAFNGVTIASQSSFRYLTTVNSSTYVIVLGGNGDDVIAIDALIADKTALLGEGGNDILYGGGGGGVQGNVLVGGDGNDTVIITDADAIDAAYEGLGDDRYVFEASAVGVFNLKTSGAPVGGNDVVDLSELDRGVIIDVGDTSLHGLVDLEFSFESTTAIEAVLGSDYADTIAGNELDNYLDGGEGDDALSGGDGDDTILGGADDDTLNGEGGEDLLSGEGGDDTLLGGDDDDTLYGGDGDDSLDGGDGIDTVDGGDGDDTYPVNLVENYDEDHFSDSDSDVAVSASGQTNQRPQFDPLPSRITIQSGLPYTLALNANPGDLGQSVNYAVSAGDLPSTATFLSDGTLNWTPSTDEQGQTFTVTFKATDTGPGALSTSIKITFYVSVTQGINSNKFIVWNSGIDANLFFYVGYPQSGYTNVIEYRIPGDASEEWVELARTDSKSYFEYLNNDDFYPSLVDTSVLRSRYTPSQLAGLAMEFRSYQANEETGDRSSYRHFSANLPPGTLLIDQESTLDNTVTWDPSEVWYGTTDFFPEYVQVDVYDANNYLQVGNYTSRTYIPFSAGSYTAPSTSGGPKVVVFSPFSKGVAGEPSRLYFGSTDPQQPRFFAYPTHDTQWFTTLSASYHAYYDKYASTPSYYIGYDNDYDFGLEDEGGNPVEDRLVTTSLNLLDYSGSIYPQGIEYPLSGDQIRLGLRYNGVASTAEIGGGIRAFYYAYGGYTELQTGDWSTEDTWDTAVLGSMPSTSAGDSYIHFYTEDNPTGSPFGNAELRFTVVDIDLSFNDVDNLTESTTGVILSANTDFSKKQVVGGNLIPDNQRADESSWLYDPAANTDLTPATLKWNVSANELLPISLTYPDDLLIWDITSLPPQIIPSGVPFYASSETNELSLMIEGLSRSVAWGDSEVVAKFHNPDNLVSVIDSDVVKYTVINFSALVDGNRDGAFALNSAADKSINFWYNTDVDRWRGDNARGWDTLDSDENRLVPSDVPQVGYTSYRDNLIVQPDGFDAYVRGGGGDIEDLFALQLEIDELLLLADPEFDITYYLTLSDKDLNPNDGVNTQINIYDTSDWSGSLDHVFMSQSPGEKAFLALSDDDVESGLNALGSHVYPGVNNYLVEVAPNFSAYGNYSTNTVYDPDDLTITVHAQIKKGVNVIANLWSSVALYARDTTFFYDRYTVDPTSSSNPNLPNDPHDPDGGPFTEYLLDAASQESLLGDAENYLLFVHGWNMSDEWKRIFADTTMKRLYWQGYSGSLGTFSWPTFVDDLGDSLYPDWTDRTYNPSEFAAYRSATVFESVLEDLNAEGIKPDVLAHSMGNVVVGEALRLWATEHGSASGVESYISTQGAVATDAYLGARPHSNNSELEDFYSVFPPLSSLNQDVSLFGLSSAAADEWINIYNPDDSALEAWQTNNYVKSNSNYVSGESWGYAYTNRFPSIFSPYGYYRYRKGQSGSALVPIVGTPLSLGPDGSRLGDAYEMLAFFGVSTSGDSIGATQVGGRFTDVHLNTLGYSASMQGGSGSPNHSFQFLYTAQITAPYWEYVVDSIGGRGYSTTA